MERASERTMDEEYEGQVLTLKRLVCIINPLEVIMGAKNVNDLVCTPNVELFDLTIERKNEIKKMYKSWLRDNHPDKGSKG